MNTILKVKNLSKTFHMEKGIEQQALKEIEFGIKEGDFIAIMGPSGSGKSTLLYNISGMDQPSLGEIFLDNTKISELGEKALSDIRLRKLGYVFQHPHLIRSLSVMENIILGASILHERVDDELENKAKKLMEKLGIENLAERDISTLSGGQAQRVSICRSLMNDPRIIFADEPTGALNSKTSDEVMNIFVDINQAGSTIMLVTHDAKVAAKANQVWFLLDGCIYKKKILGRWDKKINSLLQRQEEVMRIMAKIEV
ncbi:ABC transporter ATP-binding protein [Anaerocolumna sp.]|uniref:ABC transporter ATP-binding protein n=1 Tax=Anaerocolumna sp. TaxID=2041569 RepID=UPI0028AAF6F7|nr:ABC transporter ATP-binding protein [Anaerocolumna sp.]